MVLLSMEEHDNKDWFDFIYGEELTGFIKLRSGKVQRFTNIKTLRDPEKRHRQLHAHYFTSNNFFISLCSYSSASEGSQKNLSGLQGFQIDIDFKKMENYKDFSHEQIIWLLEKDYFNQDLPVPNIIEFSNNLRLIYIFESVIGATKKSVSMVNRIISKLTEVVRDMGGDRQTVNSMVRLPGSVNTKTGDRVQTILYSDYKYSVSEILDGWMNVYNPSKMKKKKNVTYLPKTTRTLCTGIISDLEKIVLLRDGDMEGCRAYFFHIYSSMLLSLGYDQDEIYQQTSAINKELKKPIPNLRTKLSKKAFRFKNATIIERLSMTQDEIAKMSIIIDKKEKSERRKIRHKENYVPKTKRETRVRKTRQAILDYLEKGMRQKDIAEKIGCSISTVKNHIAQMKKEGMI